MNKIIKSKGVNESERLLGHLCDTTFLKLWTFLNIYKEDGDELCDAIAIFDNHVFLFFDRKMDTFNRTDKSLNVLWERWRRGAIDAQIKTAKYSEKYILKNIGKLFLDPKCINPFPIKIPRETIIIHKIIIAHGAEEAVKKYFGSTFGSLLVNYGSSEDATEEKLFCLKLNREEKIHVFDSANVELIFNELDTFFDFKNYILMKEEAIQRHGGLFYCGEEDLLANYFSNYDRKTKNHFIGAPRKQGKFDSITFEEGLWNSYSNSEQYIQRKARYKRYRLWDRLIQYVSSHQLDGTMKGDSSFEDGKTPLYEMAKEPRFVRADFSEKIENAIASFPDDWEFTAGKLNTYMSCGDLNKMYVFIQFKGLGSDDKDRELRRELLLTTCKLMKIGLPRLKKIVGISTFSPKYSEDESLDVILFNCTNWDENENEEYLALNDEFRIIDLEKFLKIDREQTTLYEFPPPEKQKIRLGRNEPCACGSGKKYKKCCL